MSHEVKKSDAILAYTLPFILYVVPTLFENSNGLGLSYEFVCTLKGVLAAIAIGLYRRVYPRLSTNGFGLATIAGVLGFVAWIALHHLQSMIPEIPFVSSWLLAGSRTGFNPYSNGGPSFLQIAFVLVRLIELTIIVPVIEEVFWRGFLSRYLIDDDFQSVNPGTFTRFSFFFVTLAFASAHPEVLSAFAWCMLINLVYWKTHNLWSCVLMHSITNGLLGVYILMTKNWNLW